MIRLLIHGASGRMGQALVRLASQDAKITIAAGVMLRSETVNRQHPFPSVMADVLLDAPPFDVAISFALPQGIPPLIALCQSRRVPLVCGTTGLDAACQGLFRQAALEIPVMWASNFSIGVAVVTECVRRVRQALAGWDCHIVETHHTQKKDAPSGTALSLAQAATTAGQGPQIVSVRAGDIVGEHLVQFTGAGERIEIIHRATDRDIFARGALYVAKQLIHRDPGYYQIHDVLP